MNPTDRHIVVVENASDARLLVVENDEKTITVQGGENRIAISMVTAVGGGSSNQIAGVPVSIDGLIAGDVLAYNGNVFANKRQVELTDGGNF